MRIIRDLINNGRYETALELIREYKEEYPEDNKEYLSQMESLCLAKLSLTGNGVFGQALRSYYALDYETASKLLTEIQPTSTYYFYAEELLRKISIYQDAIKRQDKRIVPAQSYDIFKSQKGKLVPGLIVTSKGIQKGVKENDYRPSSSKTMDNEGTEYLIFRIDEKQGLVYTVRLSKKSNDAMYKISASKYLNTFSDGWPEAIVRVFPIENILNITAKLDDNDFEKVMLSVQKQIEHIRRSWVKALLEYYRPKAAAETTRPAHNFTERRVKEPTGDAHRPRRRGRKTNNG